MRPSLKICLTAILLTLSAIGPAQTEPTTPPAQPFRDTHYGVSFQIPAAWNLSRKDSDLSTFSLDARTAPRTAQLRAVADIAFNPFPYSTFSGALFYFSVTPHANEAACAQPASVKPPPTPSTTPLASTPFTHPYNNHGGICTETPD